MNLYTLFYTYSFSIGGYRHSLPGFVRVWADDEMSAIKRCGEELGDVFAIVAGHPEILSHTADQIKTLNWGK